MNAVEGSGLLTYKDVAAWLKFCVRHVRDKYVKTGLLKAVRSGRAVRFRAEDVHELIRRLAGETTQGAGA